MTARGTNDPTARRMRADAKEARRERKATIPRRGRGVGIVLTVSLLVVLALFAASLVYLRPPSPGSEVTLDELTRFGECASRPAGSASTDPLCSRAQYAVGQASFLDEDARVVGTLHGRDGGGGDQPFWTSYPRSDAATNDLLRNLINARAQVTVDAQTGRHIIHFIAQFLLPLVILANLFALLFHLVQGAGSGGGTADFLRFGRVHHKQRSPTPAADRTTFADVAAADETIVELAEVRDYLADPTSFVAMTAQPPKGVLLFGPPGCGKTLMARAVAGEAQAAFFPMSGSEFVEVLVGVGAARVRDLFRQARAEAPAIIFIDEIDAVGRQRGAGFGQGHDEREQTLNELLAQMDGFSSREGVVVIGATNRPDILDPALLRAGRFDRHITLERPDLQGRLEILRLHAEGRPLHDAQNDLPPIARSTPGFTGADLANLLNEAALLAVRERSQSIGRHHLAEAVDRVQTGPRRRGQVISAEDKRRIATHEAGHAVLAGALGKGHGVQKLSIIARGRGIGHLAVLQEERPISTRRDMEDQICISVGGFVAEEMLFGEPSTGSEQDLDRATTTARDMAGRFGMSLRLGLVRVLHDNREVFLGRDYLATRDVSQPTLEHLDSEVSRILREQHDRAQALLTANRSLLDRLAAALASQETLQGPELAEMLGQVGAARPTSMPAGFP